MTGVTWHTLRHTFASRLAMVEVTEGTTASLVRHSSTALVRRYAHLSPSYLQEAVEKVSSFGKSKTVEPTRAEGNQAGEMDMMEGARELEALSPVPTGPKTGKTEEGIEAL